MRAASSLRSSAAGGGLRRPSSPWPLPSTLLGPHRRLSVVWAARDGSRRPSEAGGGSLRPSTLLGSWGRLEAALVPCERLATHFHASRLPSTPLGTWGRLEVALVAPRQLEAAQGGPLRPLAAGGGSRRLSPFLGHWGRLLAPLYASWPLSAARDAPRRLSAPGRLEATIDASRRLSAAGSGWTRPSVAGGGSRCPPDASRHRGRLEAASIAPQ